MRFAILGPLRVSAGDEEVHTGGVLTQRILAMLLLRAGWVVPVPQLAEAAGTATPPKTVHRQVQNRVAALRAVLTRYGAVLESHSAGYRLRLGPDDLDATLFDRLVDQAHRIDDPH